MASQKSAAKPNTRVTKTIDGIKVTVDVRALSDMRLVRTMTALLKLEKRRDEAGDEGNAELFGELALEMMDRLDDVAKLIFGDDSQAVQDALAEKNDGYLSFMDWYSFISDVLQRYQKNFDARPLPEH